MKLHNSKLGEKFHFLILHILTNQVKDFHSGTEGLICQKNTRGGWSGFGKALIWDPSQMITCHPKNIPKFLLIGGVVQFWCTTKLWPLKVRKLATKSKIDEKGSK